MSNEDKARWDERYSAAPRPNPRVPEGFSQYEHLFPTSGAALDVACGLGSGSLWLAKRGLTVVGLDVSPLAIDSARTAAAQLGLGERCEFQVADLDDGLPPGAGVDVVICHRFREPALYTQFVDRLLPGGILAIVVLSEVDAGPGPFRAGPGELASAFAKLDIRFHHEGNGQAVLLASASSS